MMTMACVRAASVALCMALPSGALASTLVNGDFNDDSSFLPGWTLAPGSSIGAQTCTISVVGCAPGGDGWHAVLSLDGTANAGISQEVAINGPAILRFGAIVSFGTIHPTGNPARGDITLSDLDGGPSASVGRTVGDLAGQYTIQGLLGYSFTPWFDLVGALRLDGTGPRSVLFNIHTSGAAPDSTIIFIAENAFLTVHPIPLPPALPLLLGGLLALRQVGRSPRRS